MATFLLVVAVLVIWAILVRLLSTGYIAVYLRAAKARAPVRLLCVTLADLCLLLVVIAGFLAPPVASPVLGQHVRAQDLVLWLYGLGFCVFALVALLPIARRSRELVKLRSWGAL